MQLESKQTYLFPASSKWPFDYPQMEVTKRPEKATYGSKR